jgi:hypothetical protein
MASRYFRGLAGPALVLPAALFCVAIPAPPAQAFRIHPALARDYLSPGLQIAPETRRLAGRLTLVEPDSFFLRVNDGRASIPLTLGEAAFVTIDFRPARLADLAAGQEVTIEYRAAEGGPIASAIQVLTSPAAQPGPQVARER